MSPAPGLTVELPVGSAAVKATTAASTTGPLERPVYVGGVRFPSAIAVLAPARHLSIRGQFPAGGVTLTFRIRRGSVPRGTTPFLASLDPATGQWIPVASRYDAAAGTVSAQVTHFSIWTVLDWVASKVAAVLSGALSDIFGPIEAGPGVPACEAGGSSGAVAIIDSNPSAAIGACAQAAGQAHVLARVANLRRYPVDLLYPAGTQVSVPATDVFTQIGEDLNNVSSSWHDRVLLPGSAEADATTALAAGQTTRLITEMDTEAYLTGILGTALNVLAAMTGKLATSTAQVLDVIAKGTCLRDLARSAQTTALTLPSAESIGALGFECVSAAAKLGGVGAVASLASIMSSLASELIAGAWGIIDTATGAGYHVLTLSRAAETVYIDQYQSPLTEPAPVFKPVKVDLAGDGTYLLEDMTWQTWSDTEAAGTGTAAIDDCNPSCAGGHWYYVPVKAVFSQPVRGCTTAPSGGPQYFWSQADLTYPTGLPGPVAGTYGLWKFAGIAQEASQGCTA
ncbi:MAG: hypothetical protein ACRDPY_18260 [Streptosporangiaceae bacterium]